MVDSAELRSLIDALEVFNQAPDKASIDRANSWLQDFQHSVNSFRHSAYERGGSNGNIDVVTPRPKRGQHANICWLRQMHPPLRGCSPHKR
jgi:hypothetical protein